MKVFFLCVHTLQKCTGIFHCKSFIIFTGKNFKNTVQKKYVCMLVCVHRLHTFKIFISIIDSVCVLVCVHTSMYEIVCIYTIQVTVYLYNRF